MQRLYRRHGDCLQCDRAILRGHVDNKFCSLKCRRAFDNAINNATTALKKKIHPAIEQRYGERSQDLFQILEQNDKVLRRIIRYHDFGFLPVPRLVLQKEGFDFRVFSATEINPRTDGRIYWTYAMGVEVGSDWEHLTIRFRHSDGSLRQMNQPCPRSL